MGMPSGLVDGFLLMRMTNQLVYYQSLLDSPLGNSNNQCFPKDIPEGISKKKLIVHRPEKKPHLTDTMTKKNLQWSAEPGLHLMESNGKMPPKIYAL